MSRVSFLIAAHLYLAANAFAAPAPFCVDCMGSGSPGDYILADLNSLQAANDVSRRILSDNQKPMRAPVGIGQIFSEAPAFAASSSGAWEPGMELPGRWPSLDEQPGPLFETDPAKDPRLAQLYSDFRQFAAPGPCPIELLPQASKVIPSAIIVVPLILESAPTAKDKRSTAAHPTRFDRR